VLLTAATRGITRIQRRMPQHAVNTVTTNVRGPENPLYALGCEMLEYLPFVPVAGGVRIGVAILSYNGRIAFGVTGDYDTARDVHYMAHRIEAEVLALREHAELQHLTAASARRTGSVVAR
jgi:diacylglycerol O-acyltransferase